MGLVLVVLVVVLIAGWNDRSFGQSVFLILVSAGLTAGAFGLERGSAGWVCCTIGLVLLTIILFLVWKGGDQRLPLR